jgi:hypothetical protein
MILIFGLLASAYPTFLMNLKNNSTRPITFILFISLIFLIDNYFYLPSNTNCIFLDGSIKMTELN